MNRQFRSVLFLTLLSFAITSPSCAAQERSRRMIPGASNKELVPEKPVQGENGIVRITLGRLFKPGPTEYTRVGAVGLKGTPPLPTGSVLFKDLAYQIKTEAIISDSQITVFSLPSVENEAEFSKLSVLHLDDDEMSPEGRSWNEVTVYPGGWDKHFHHVSKDQYDAVPPDFSSKRIAAVTDGFGIFAIALAPESEPEQLEPFPAVVLKQTSSPEPVQPGQEVSHTLLFTNKGTTAAAEVNVKEVLDIYLEYVSAIPSQGTCKQKIAGNNIVCHLGALPSGASATVTIISRARNPFFKDINGKSDALKVVPNTLKVVFKQKPSDFVDERGQIHAQVTTTITNKQ